ncbi:MAG: helix-turn-helix domain-containing protein [Methylomicrobium sp.]
MSRKTKSPEIARLKTFMQTKKLTATELAASIEIPERTLNNYIWNDKPLVGHLLRRLQTVHGVSIDWLVSGHGSMFVSALGVGEQEPPYDMASPDNIAPDALMPYFETTDLNNLSDYWWLVAKSVEQSLIQSGAVPGQDYSLLDLYELAQPFVLERMKARGLDITANESLS